MSRSRCTALLLALFPTSIAAQDTLVVRADNPPVWGTNPRLVEELRIGVLEGDPAYTFGFVPTVVQTSDGVVWVPDRGPSHVRRYSPTGEHLGDIGRKGKGPNEFDYISDIVLLPNDRVGVLDPFNGRTAVYDLAGTRLGQFRAPVNMVGPEPAMVVDTAGQMYVYDLQLIGPPPAPPAEPLPTGATFVPPPRRAVWIQMSARGQILDTIAIARTEGEGGPEPVATRSYLSPFGYQVVGRNDEYALHRPLPDGRIVRIERSWTPVRYEQGEREEKEAIQEAGARRQREMGFGDGNADRVPATKPAFFNFSIDADGRIWVSRYVRATQLGESEGQRQRRLNAGMSIPRTWGQPSVYDVIEPTGRYLGTVTIPNSASSDFDASRAKPVFVRGMTFWTIEKGEYDEQYVVRYRIVPGN